MMVGQCVIVPWVVLLPVVAEAEVPAVVCGRQLPAN